MRGSVRRGPAVGMLRTQIKYSGYARSGPTGWLADPGSTPGASTFFARSRARSRRSCRLAGGLPGAARGEAFLIPTDRFACASRALPRRPIDGARRDAPMFGQRGASVPPARAGPRRPPRAVRAPESRRRGPRSQCSRRSGPASRGPSRPSARSDIEEPAGSSRGPRAGREGRATVSRRRPSRHGGHERSDGPATTQITKSACIGPGMRVVVHLQAIGGDEVDPNAEAWTTTRMPGPL